MKYKILFVDYDNTITNTKGKVTDRTKTAIKNYINAGGKFIITTSRPYWMIKNHAEELNLDGDIICSQGASIINLKTDEYLNKLMLEKEDLQQIVKFSSKKTYYTIVASDYELVTDRTTPIFMSISKRIGFNFENQSYKTFFEDMQKIDPIQVLCRSITASGNFNFAKNFKSKFEDKYGIHICSNHLTAITNKEASKGKALKLYSQLNDVDLSQTAAFGDSIGDASMYEYAGLSVAMGNAHKKLKEGADLIIEHTDKDGLAKFIENLL
ncbi:MAG: Cof-type HAD-IIB family hydrolase [Clostridia bacterium]|nr:Cof-type HAD-IIB family hydrolase [Clostridia bacterium]